MKADAAKSGAAEAPPAEALRPRRGGSDWRFFYQLLLISAFYVLLIVALLASMLYFVSMAAPGDVAPEAGSRLARIFGEVFASPDIRYATLLSLTSCTVTALLSLITAIPIGYLMARRDFWGKHLIDALLDVPIVIPPLVLGLGLLILFQTEVWHGQTLENLIEALSLKTEGGLNAALAWVEGLLPWRLPRVDLPNGVTYRIPAVILAQYLVACAFAVRTMRATFDQINPRQEDVALTLGSSRAQAFWRVVLPQSRRGVLTAGTLAWARSLGEFGPILVFAGATRGKTEVLSTSVFLELSVGNIEGAVAVSLMMVCAAVGVLIVVRFFGRGSILQ